MVLHLNKLESPTPTEAKPASGSELYDTIYKERGLTLT